MPNTLMAPVHNRMPVILRPEYERGWLEMAASEEAWHRVLGPYPAEEMTAYAVSTRVNSPRNDDESMLAPA